MTPDTAAGKALPAEPRTTAGQALADRLAEPDDYEWGNSIRSAILTIEAEARREPLALLLPFLRHTAMCRLQAVRDNAPDDPDCTCPLRAAYLAALPEQEVEG